MKKTMMFLGVLSLGLAQAQQEFEGKVGVNTDTPSATLNVKSKTGNVGGTNFQLESPDGTKMVTVLDNGNVGIGTIDPRKRLQVNGITNISNYNTFTGDEYQLSVRSTTEKLGEFYYRNDDTNPRLFIKGGPRNITLYTNYTKGGSADLGFGSNSEPNLLFLREKTGVRGSSKNVVGIGTLTPEYKLHVKADADPLKLEGLQETTDATAKNLVVVDGVVKIGESVSTGATQLTGEANLACNNDNRGKMNFIKDVALQGGGKADAFAVCLKSSDGQFVWRYLYGGQGVSNQTGNFGDNLNP